MRSLKDIKSRITHSSSATSTNHPSTSTSSVTERRQSHSESSGSNKKRFFCCRGSGKGFKSNTRRKRGKFPIPSISNLFQSAMSSGDLTPDVSPTVLSPNHMASSSSEKEEYLPNCNLQFGISNSRQEDRRTHPVDHKSQTPRCDDFYETYQSDIGDEYRSECDVDGDFIEEMHYGSMSPISPATTFSPTENLPSVLPANGEEFGKIENVQEESHHQQRHVEENCLSRGNCAGDSIRRSWSAGSRVRILSSALNVWVSAHIVTIHKDWLYCLLDDGNTKKVDRYDISVQPFPANTSSSKPDLHSNMMNAPMPTLAASSAASADSASDSQSSNPRRFDVNDITPSLHQIRLNHGDVIDLLNRIDIAATNGIRGHLKMKQNDREDSGSAKSDSVDPVATTKPIFDWKTSHKADPSSVLNRHDVSKFSFVSSLQSERVFVKLTMTSQYKERMMRNIIKNDVLNTYWTSVVTSMGDDEQVDDHLPFLPLRGWWISEDRDTVMCTVYPLAMNLSDYIQSAVVSDSDFAEFEGSTISRGDNDRNDGNGVDIDIGPLCVDWRLNLQQMKLIRDSLFEIAEFVANLHFDDVSHRNISMRNIYVDLQDPKSYYITNYAQWDMEWAFASPEALLYRENLLSAYSTTGSDVWSFGCLLLGIFASDADLCIARLNNLRTISCRQMVQGLLLRHLNIRHSSQSKLISLLDLLLKVFTPESVRCSMEDICNHVFFAAPWSTF